MKTNKQVLRADFVKRMGKCIVCGKKIKMMVQKNTGFCCARHQKEHQRDLASQ